MTFSVRNVVGVMQARKVSAVILTAYDSWSPWTRWAYDFFIGCHLSHALDFAFAIGMYTLVWPWAFPKAAVWSLDWVAAVVAYHLATEALTFGVWHRMTNGDMTGPVANGKLAAFKFNKANPYFVPSERLHWEMLFTTLGFLQAAAWQCALMHLWASRTLPFVAEFWIPGATAHNAWNVGSLVFVTYWREFHFWCGHRLMHPWGWRVLGVVDPGQVLYNFAHSLHHKSHNPGPWSGLSMHPVEHVIYFTCAALPFLGLLGGPFAALSVHPMHHLYALFHALVAPVGGHDGYDLPGGGSDHHYLHHAAFECNFGVPLIDFDRLFGTHVELSWYEATGKNLRYAMAYGKALKANGGNADAALAAVADKFKVSVDAVAGKKKGN